MPEQLIADIKSFDKIPEYWASLKPKQNIDALVEDAWKKKVAFMDEVSLQNNVVIFLWNAYTNRFLYMSDKLKVLAGIDPSLYTAEDGVAYSLSLVHPDHLEATLLLQQRQISYCMENNMLDYNNLLLSVNYLYKNGVGEYMQILQRGIVLEVDDNGAPSLCLSFIHYVGHIKKQDSVGGVISTPGGEVIIFDYDVANKCVQQSKTISDQEKKVIQLLANGYNTKSISKELYISPHTVATHRRNLIKKTNCIDSTGVVAFAKLINLI